MAAGEWTPSHPDRCLLVSDADNPRAYRANVTGYSARVRLLGEADLLQEADEIVKEILLDDLALVVPAGDCAEVDVE